MTDHNQNPKPHSAEYFGETRNFWWNEDFLALMARRLAFDQVKSVLDVGCGIGHWGQCLAPFFPVDARVTGIDTEQAWIEKAAERARAVGKSDRYHYQVGDVTALPFADDTFDLVTGQTVLIHLKDPKAGLREMLRVLKPGGALLAVEPNNFASHATFSSLGERQSIEEILDGLRFELMIERGKQALGLGFNSAGDLIPGYLAELGAENIQVYLSDKTSPYFPPYSSDEQRANIEEARAWAKRGFIGWDRDEALRYFVAGGGSNDDFDRYYASSRAATNEAIAAIDRGAFHAAGGALTYLIAARKK